MRTRVERVERRPRSGKQHDESRVPGNQYSRCDLLGGNEIFQDASVEYLKEYHVVGACDVGIKDLFAYENNEYYAQRKRERYGPSEFLFEFDGIEAYQQSAEEQEVMDAERDDKPRPAAESRHHCIRRGYYRERIAESRCKSEKSAAARRSWHIYAVKYTETQFYPLNPYLYKDIF